MSDARKSRQEQYFEFVNDRLAEDGSLSAKAAFEIAAGHFGVSAGNVSTAYYRMKRQIGDAFTQSDRSRAAYAAKYRAPVPEELDDALAALRAGVEASERVIAWVERRRNALDEREASIERREREAKDRLQRQIADLFP